MVSRAHAKRHGRRRFPSPRAADGSVGVDCNRQIMAACKRSPRATRTTGKYPTYAQQAGPCIMAKVCPRSDPSHALTWAVMVLGPPCVAGRTLAVPPPASPCPGQPGPPQHQPPQGIAPPAVCPPGPSTLAHLQKGLSPPLPLLLSLASVQVAPACARWCGAVNVGRISFDPLSPLRTNLGDVTLRRHQSNTEQPRLHAYHG